jgi:hypothetical protein
MTKHHKKGNNFYYSLFYCLSFSELKEQLVIEIDQGNDNKNSADNPERQGCIAEDG